MDLYKEILTKILMDCIDTALSSSKFDFDRLVEHRCYETLCKIKEVIDDDTLEDCECFSKIEEIVCLFESIGSSGGNRHDFG